MNALREFAGIAPIDEAEQQSLIAAQAQAQQAAMAASNVAPIQSQELPVDPGNSYP